MNSTLWIIYMPLRDKSVTLMRFYGFPHHGDRFFAGALNDALPVFPTTGTDPSHPLRMTFNISLIMTLNASLIMTPFLQSSFWTGASMPCGKDGKRNDESEWRIYYPDDVLPASSPRVQILRIRSGWRFMVFFITAASLRHLRVTPDRPPSEEAAGARSAIEDTRLS